MSMSSFEPPPVKIDLPSTPSPSRTNDDAVIFAFVLGPRQPGATPPVNVLGQMLSQSSPAAAAGSDCWAFPSNWNNPTDCGAFPCALAIANNANAAIANIGTHKKRRLRWL